MRSEILRDLTTAVKLPLMQGGKLNPAEGVLMLRDDLESAFVAETVVIAVEMLLCRLLVLITAAKDAAVSFLGDLKI